MKAELKARIIDPEELNAFLERVKYLISKDDFELLKAIINTVIFILEKLRIKDFQLKRFLKQKLGIKSEKSKKIFKEEDSKDNEKSGDKGKSSNHNDYGKGENNEKSGDNDDGQSDNDDGQGDNDDGQGERKKGHGRNGAKDYPGAKRVPIKHQKYKKGDLCPACEKGKLYPQKPGVFILLEGNPPVEATIYEPEKFRCNLCGEIFNAELPDNLPDDPHRRRHYDETARTVMVVLKYGCGFPMYRLEKLQENLGVPLPATSQWDQIEATANLVNPAYKELEKQAAQGSIIHSDDTHIKILEVMQIIEEEKQNGEGDRTGIFTTGIVSIVDDHEIAIFFSGRKHSGENSADLLQQRDDGRSPPISMTDAKKGAAPKDTDIIECNCNVHARRKFVEILDDFPDECEYVIIEVFQEFFKNDQITKEQNMTPQERLDYHQEHTKPIMDKFFEWLNNQLNKNKVEPNSTLGKAIQYTLNHWDELTRFLHVPGAPVDNNICERAIKKVVLFRKNSLFFKNELGAEIGDIFLSIIHTCELNGVNAFDYITQLQKNSEEVKKNPSKWLPWNYNETLDQLEAAAK